MKMVATNPPIVYRATVVDLLGLTSNVDSDPELDGPNNVDNGELMMMKIYMETGFQI